MLPFLEEVGEVSAFAVLRHDVHIVRSLVDVQQPDDIVVLHLLHDVDLQVDVLEVVGVREDLLIDDLDGDQLASADRPT